MPGAVVLRSPVSLSCCLSGPFQRSPCEARRKVPEQVADAGRHRIAAAHGSLLLSGTQRGLIGRTYVLLEYLML